MEFNQTRLLTPCSTKMIKKRRGPPGIYPWERWLKLGSKHTLKQGKDFTSKVSTMVIYIYTRAKGVGRCVSIYVKPEGVLKLTVVGKVKHAKAN